MMLAPMSIPAVHNLLRQHHSRLLTELLGALWVDGLWMAHYFWDFRSAVPPASVTTPHQQRGDLPV